MNNERTTGFLGSLAESTRAEEKNHRGTEGTERCATSASVPSVPLWFKRLDKNVVLLVALIRFLDTVWLFTYFVQLDKIC